MGSFTICAGCACVCVSVRALTLPNAGLCLAAPVDEARGGEFIWQENGGGESITAVTWDSCLLLGQESSSKHQAGGRAVNSPPAPQSCSLSPLWEPLQLIRGDQMWLVPVVPELQESRGALVQVLPVGKLTKEHEERGPSGKPHSLAARLDKSIDITVPLY